MYIVFDPILFYIFVHSSKKGLSCTAAFCVTFTTKKTYFPLTKLVWGDFCDIFQSNFQIIHICKRYENIVNFDKEQNWEESNPV